MSSTRPYNYLEILEARSHAEEQARIDRERATIDAIEAAERLSAARDQIERVARALECDPCGLDARVSALLEEMAALRDLLRQCNPPGYIVEPAPRSSDKEWVWDGCNEEWDSYGDADTEEEARADAWQQFYKAEAERDSGER